MYIPLDIYTIPFTDHVYESHSTIVVVLVVLLSKVSINISVCKQPSRLILLSI